MVYNEFLETMKKQMELALGDGYSLTLRKVQKNNSLILDGLCIEKDGKMCIRDSPRTVCFIFYSSSIICHYSALF